MPRPPRHRVRRRGRGRGGDAGLTGRAQTCRASPSAAGVSVIATITTPYLPPYIVPAAKIGHAGVEFAVGMVFPADAVTMRQCRSARALRAPLARTWRG